MRRWRCCAEAPTQGELDAFLAAAVRAAPATQDLALHGPLAAPIPRRAGARIADKSSSNANTARRYRRSCRHGSTRCALPKQRNVRWSIDVDPVDLY
jgi:primosomal protein N' (replication factor Y)